MQSHEVSLASITKDLENQTQANEALQKQVSTSQEARQEALAMKVDAEARMEQIKAGYTALGKELEACREANSKLLAQHQRDLAEHKGLLDASFVDAEVACQNQNPNPNLDTMPCK